MTLILNKNWMKAPYIREVIQAVNGNIRFIGGCVRDAVLDYPIKDIDMATPLTPDVVTKLLGDAGIKAVPTGINFGTVTAVTQGHPIEITTLRKDTACDGRHAQVEFTDSWELDAARRDFTMNAMSCDTDGVVHDYFNGITDAKAGRVRFIGDAHARCKEDYLRILRFFRFLAYYGKAPFDTPSLMACEQHALGIHQLSGERIQHEMLRLLAAPSLVDVLACMQETTVLEVVLSVRPDMASLHVLEALEKTHQYPPEPLVRLALLLRSTKLDDTLLADIIGRWKLSNKDSSGLKILCFPPYLLQENDRDDVHKQHIRQYGKILFEQLLKMRWAEKSLTNPKRYCSLLALCLEWYIPLCPISAKDIIELGVAPGKTLGWLLKAAEEYWEQEHYRPNKEQLLDVIRQKI